MNTHKLGGLLCCALVLGSLSHAQAGWVLEREEKTGPLFEEKKPVVAQQLNEQQQWLAVRQTYRQALQAYRQQIRQHWPTAEVSSASRWVAYDDHWQAKRVVDFAQQRIEISVLNGNRSQPDFAALNLQVSQQLAILLGSRIGETLDRDPVHRALQRQLVALGAAPVEASNELVMAALFSEKNPRAEQIRHQAKQLMQKAYIRYQALSASLDAASVSEDAKRITYMIPLPENWHQARVRAYLPMVDKQAQRFGLDRARLLAVMHSASQFNPLARSHRPAIGLLQVTPLHPQHAPLAANELYQVEENLAAGAARLQQLQQQLSAITNPQSRWYLSLAAYQGGGSAVVNSFTPGQGLNEAVVSINGLSAAAVLKQLLSAAPDPATRDFVKQVVEHEKGYQRYSER